MKFVQYLYYFFCCTRVNDSFILIHKLCCEYQELVDEINCFPTESSTWRLSWQTVYFALSKKLSNVLVLKRIFFLILCSGNCAGASFSSDPW